MLRIASKLCAFKQISETRKCLISTRLYLTQTAQMPFNGKQKFNINLKRVNERAQNMFFSAKSGAGDFNDSESTEYSEKLPCKGSNESEKESQAADIDGLKMIGSSVDIDSEMLRYDYEEFDEKEIITKDVMKRKPKKTLPISLTRGESGVFEVDELCTLLKNDNIRDICVIRVPPEIKYVDFLIFATGRSTRHIRAVAEYIKWAYKQKRVNNDPQTVLVEGESTLDWFALDLGNIAVHLMLQNTRSAYDLEQLWSVGPDYDEQMRLQSLSETSAATSLEEFSFDSELERFRKLREEEAKQTVLLHLNKNFTKKPKQLKTAAKLNMDGVV